MDKFKGKGKSKVDEQIDNQVQIDKQKEQEKEKEKERLAAEAEIVANAIKNSIKNSSIPSSSSGVTSLTGTTSNSTQTPSSSTSDQSSSKAQKLNDDELLKKRFFMAQSQNRDLERSQTENQKDKIPLRSNNQDQISSRSTQKIKSVIETKSNSLNGGNQTITLGEELNASANASPNSNSSSSGGFKDSFSGPNSMPDSQTLNSNSTSTSSSSSNSNQPSASDLPILTSRPDIPISRPPILDHPFNTRDFVQRLQHGGWVNGWISKENGYDVDGSWNPNSNSNPSSSTISASNSGSGSGNSEEGNFKGKGKGKDTVEETGGEDSRQAQIMLSHRHDPAEGVMEAVRYLLISRGEGVVERCLNKGDLENVSTK